MQKIVLLLSLFWIFDASAAIIQDPTHVLDKLDQEFGQVSFADAFHCGDSAKIRIFHKNCRIGCGADGCSSICEASREEFMRTAGECSADSISLIDADGTIDVLSTEEFQQLRGNLLRRELAALDVFLGMTGTVSILSSASTPFALASGETIPSWEIQGSFTNPTGRSLSWLYQVGVKTPGIAQVLFKRVNGTKIFKVREINRK